MYNELHLSKIYNLESLNECRHQGSSYTIMNIGFLWPFVMTLFHYVTTNLLSVTPHLCFLDDMKEIVQCRLIFVWLLLLTRIVLRQKDPHGGFYHRLGPCLLFADSLCEYTLLNQLLVFGYLRYFQSGAVKIRFPRKFRSRLYLQKSFRFSWANLLEGKC